MKNEKIVSCKKETRLTKLKDNKYLLNHSSMNEAIEKLGKLEDLEEKFGADLEISLGIGEPLSRNKVFDKLIGDGIQLATLIHPDVHIPDTTIVRNGVTIQYGCFISCNVKRILNMF